MPSATEFSGFETLRHEVEANGNLLAVRMERLRDAYGVGKLGVHVRRGIAEKLGGVGLGFFPGPDLPTYQEQEVRLYRRGTPVADIIDAVVAPSEYGDARLREAGAPTDAVQLLDRIRELVSVGE